jgi:predicted ester cyclase
MSVEDSKALVRRLFDIINQGNLALLDEVIAPGSVHRNPADPNLPSGAEGWRRMEAPWQAAFPDGRSTIEDQIAEGDKVVTRWRFRGTHQGEIFGIAPTGKQIEFTGIFIDRVAGGRIVEHWDEADILGVLQQLGAVR